MRMVAGIITLGLVALAGCARVLTPPHASVSLPYSTMDDVAPACPPPALDTARWERVRATVAPVSFQLPRDWSRARCPESDPSVELWCGPGPGEVVSIQRGEGEPGRPTAQESSSHPVVSFTTCEEAIGGQLVWIGAGIQTGYSHIAGAWAAWRLPSGGYAYVAATGERRIAHERALMILRTVRVSAF